MKIPTAVQLHRQSRTLELSYGVEEKYQLSCELLRVWSPSAEVRGHGQGQEQLQTGKKNVSINEIKAVGNYALQLCFDDGHDTGLYSWDYLYELCREQDRYWDQYLEQMRAAGASRDPDVQVLQFDPGAPSG